MSQIRLKISAKQLDRNVNYHNPITYESIKLNERSNPNINFLKEIVTKEVKTKKDRKKFIRIALRVITASVSILTFVEPTTILAATLDTTLTPVMGSNQITQSEIITLCKWLVGICVTLSFGIALVMSVIAGSLGYFRKLEASNKWVVEIIKSFVTVMIAPTIIVLIAVAAYLLFGGSEWFVKPF